MRVPWDRSGLRSYLIFASLVVGDPSPESIVLGSPFVFGGIALHLWAKGCLHQNQEVTDSGPYRFVRHPFYLANLFLDAGIALMSGSWLLQLVLPIWWLAVYLPAMAREERAMIARFGDAYRRYRDRVPRFVPRRWPLARSKQSFSLHNPNLLRTELPRTLRFLCYPPIFFLAYGLRSEGLGLLVPPFEAEAVAAASCVTLYASSLAIRRNRSVERARPVPEPHPAEHRHFPASPK